MHRISIGAMVVIVGLLVAAVAHADGDTDALLLADGAVTAPVASSNWLSSFELAAGSYNAASQTDSVLLNDNARASLSVTYDGAITSSLRAVLGNRLDAGWRAGTDQYNAVDTLQQAYLSWQPGTSAILDAGRINLHEGVGVGFNPTDYFKASAIRSIVSIDPASLRQDRLGTVMLRGQMLWDGGALSALVAPALPSTSDSGVFSPGFDATNHQLRYQLSATERLFDGFSPEWLLYGGAGIDPQVGLNMTMLVGNATVAFFEYSAGRSPTLAETSDTSSAFHSKFAAGLTHTFPGGVTLSLEYDYDGASANGATWSALAADRVRYWQYRNTVTAAQDLMTRQSLFLFATWKDALVRHLDVTAMCRYDLIDDSRLVWLETRYHWPRADLAVQWQITHGSPYSTYGAQAQTQIVQGVLTFFF